jgi:hypothetical protein
MGSINSHDYTKLATDNPKKNSIYIYFSLSLPPSYLPLPVPVCPSLWTRLFPRHDSLSPSFPPLLTTHLDFAQNRFALSLFHVNLAIKCPTSSSLSGDSSPNRDFLPYLSPRHGRPSLMPAPPLLWFVRRYSLSSFEPLLAFSPPLL